MAKNDINEKGEVHEELSEYIKNQINVEVEKAVRKADNKLLKHKSWIIFEKNIAILILLALICAGVYYLYRDKYFDKFFTKVEYVKEKDNVPVANEEEKPVDYDKEYGHYLSYIILNEKSEYIKDYYEGNLTNELKLYLSLSLINESDIQIEDNTIIVPVDVIKKQYEDFFNEGFAPMSFKYNDITFKYLKTQNIFVAEGSKLNRTSNIKREITGAEVNGHNLKLIVTEAIVRDGIVYNVVSGKKIGKQKDSLKDYAKQLNTLVYEFEDAYLAKIERN